VLPPRIKQGSNLYERWQTKLFDDSQTSQLRGTKFALNKVKMIIKATGGIEI
jgi:hypothetical protein